MNGRTPGETALLITVELIAAGTWVGGLVCIALVAHSARHVLDEASQVTFFRAIGRRYGIVGTASLLVAIAAGLALAWPPSSWSGPTDAAVALAGVLVLATAAGMAQARAMTVRRRQLIEAPDDTTALHAVRQGRLAAAALRSLMALITMAIVVLAAIVIAH